MSTRGLPPLFGAPWERQGGESGPENLASALMVKTVTEFPYMLVILSRGMALSHWDQFRNLNEARSALEHMRTGWPPGSTAVIYKIDRVFGP